MFVSVSRGFHRRRFFGYGPTLSWCDFLLWDINGVRIIDFRVPFFDNEQIVSLAFGSEIRCRVSQP